MTGSPDLPQALVDSVATLREADEQHNRGEFDTAIETYEQILEVYRDNGLEVGSMPARIHHGLGACRLGLGDAEGAMTELGRGMNLLGPPDGELDHLPTRAALLNTTGMALRTSGHYRRAREAYEMAARCLRDSPEETLVAVFGNLGALASHLGDLEGALTGYEAQWETAERCEAGEEMRGAALLNLGGANRDLGQLPVALGQLEEALRLLRASGNRPLEGQALLSLSELHSRAGDPERARELASQALAVVAEVAPESELFARCLFRRAVLTPEADENDAAVEDLRACVDLIDRVAPVSPDARRMREMLAAHLLVTGNDGEALRRAEEGVEAAEQLRKAAGPGLSRQIATISADAYDTLASLLVLSEELGDAERLVEVLEARRGRWLLDELAQPATATTTPSHEAVRAARAEARRLLREAVAARRELSRGTAHPELDADALRRIDSLARQRISAFEAELAVDGAIPPRILDCTAIRDRLEPGQTLLHCLTTLSVSAVVTVTADQALLRRLHHDQGEIEEAVDAIAEAALAGRVIDESALHSLAADLLADLPTAAEEVIVVSDGPLHRLPWALIPDLRRGGLPLGTSRTISCTISATSHFALASRERARAEKSLLLVGNPAYTEQQFPDERDRELAGTAEELATIAALDPDCTVIEREAATEARVIAELRRHRHAHIACHGIANIENAAYAGLVLAPPQPGEDAWFAQTDDVLEAWEIEDLCIPCETVVLSSCSTAAGEIQRGEGLVGLAHAFQLAGAREVLAALWPVDDRAAARFMADVYEQLADGQSLAAAVRLARRAHAGERPAHWAPWVVFGPAPGQ